VLVHGQCQDPTAQLDIDLEEGPEPNGFEPAAIPAGVITLEAEGADGFVIHGCIRPVDDQTPDFDVYLLEVTAPTLVKITADGVEGLAAGFAMTTTAGEVRIRAEASGRYPLPYRSIRVILATGDSRRLVLEPTGFMLQCDSQEPAGGGREAAPDRKAV
jgi:hypothetical protein